MRKNNLKICLSFICMLFCLIASSAADTEAAHEKTVLIIYSFTQNFAPDFQITTECNRDLSTTGIQYRVKHLELDAFSPKAATYPELDRKIASELPKMRKGEYDVIVPMGQIAIDLLARHAVDIPESTSVVYCGLDVVANELMLQHHNTVGVFGEVALRENIDYGLQVFPDTKKIILLADWSVAGKRVAGAGARLRKLYPGLEIQIPDNSVIGLNKLLSILRGQSEDVIVLFHSWFNTDSTNLSSLDYMISNMSRSKAHVFATQQTMIYGGVFGGVCVPVDELGRALSSRIGKILNGADAYEILPVCVALKSYAEWNAVKKSGVSGSKVPGGTVILGKHSFLRPDQVPWVVGMLAVIFLLAVILFMRTRYEKRICTALKMARNAEQAESRFLADMSHEIRTPLNAVVGYSELLKDGESLSGDESREFTKNIFSASRSLLSLINDLLDISKLKAMQMEIITSPTDLKKIASEVMDTFSLQTAEHGVAMNMKIAPMPMLDLDALRMRQMLFNLVGNAVKFTKKGSITLSITFTPHSDTTGELRIAVSDTGIGISPAGLKNIMKPYVQVSGMRDANGAINGTGLGLAITKRLAENMNGELRVESKLGSGSSFTIILKQVSISRGQEEPETPAPESHGRSNFSDIAVLIVDDVKMNCAVLSALCGKTGIVDTDSVCSGAAALEALKKKHYDLVLTDMLMPGMSGAELSGKIHSDPEHADIPVVVVTADIDTNADTAYDLFDGILLKPVTLEKLTSVLRSARRK